MALFRCSDGADVLENNKVYNIGTSTASATALSNGSATINVQDACTLIVNIKGSGFTNLALTGGGSMNVTVGIIKNDGTMTATARTNAASYPTNDVTDADVVIINGWTTTAIGTIALAFT